MEEATTQHTVVDDCGQHSVASADTTIEPSVDFSHCSVRLTQGLGFMYVVIARWYTKEGTQNQVLSILNQVVPLSRAEEGNRTYIVNQSVDDPRSILLYEQYVDEDAFRFHASRDIFGELVRDKIWPLLETRHREIYTAIEPA